MKNLCKYSLSRIRIIASLIILSITIEACEKTEPAFQPPIVIVNPSDSTKSILFVGNSLTYYNDLPGLVAKLGKDSGIVIKTEMVAYPNYALEDHWNDGQIQTLIATKNMIL